MTKMASVNMKIKKNFQLIAWRAMGVTCTSIMMIAFNMAKP